jgi:hypothetical protein
MIRALVPWCLALHTSGPAIVGPDVSLFNYLKRKALYPNHLPLHYPRHTNGGYHHGPGPLRHESAVLSSRTPVHRSLWLFPGFVAKSQSPDTPEDSENDSLTYMPVFHVIEPSPLSS